VAIVRIVFLLHLLAAFALAAPPRPNVVLIFIDDQGYYDLGCYGATEVKTPRIDGLAREGVRFTDYYAAAPICSPSRAGLLTGCYPRRVGMEVWVQRADSKRGLHADELTIAELFKANGYRTACIGKWHLGDSKEFKPLAQGFDSYFGLMHNLDPVEVVYFDEDGPPLVRGDGEVVKKPVDPAELTRLYTDEAIRMIRDPSTSSASSGQAGSGQRKPFFLYLPHTMLHNPLGVGEEFKGSSKWGEYGDAIQELDHHVGRIIDALKETGVMGRTIVVYASDNGRGPGRNKEQRLKGRKLTTMECGIRVPAIVSGPGVGIRGEHVSEELVTAMDWYPTLASLAGIRVPEGRVIDGRDLSPLLLGKTDAVPAPGGKMSLNAEVPLRRRWEQPGEWKPLFSREEYLNAFFYHGAEGQLSAVRSGKYKLFLNPGLELYDLEKDPGETKPVRGPAARKLRGMAVMFQEEMNLDARRAGYVE
jgi:arylsulfatase A